jgi:hypothetical protein
VGWPGKFKFINLRFFGLYTKLFSFPTFEKGLFFAHHGKKKKVLNS